MRGPWLARVYLDIVIDDHTRPKTKTITIAAETYSGNGG